MFITFGGRCTCCSQCPVCADGKTANYLIFTLAGFADSQAYVPTACLAFPICTDDPGSFACITIVYNSDFNGAHQIDLSTTAETSSTCNFIYRTTGFYSFGDLYRGPLGCVSCNPPQSDPADTITNLKYRFEVEVIQSKSSGDVTATIYSIDGSDARISTVAFIAIAASDWFCGSGVTTTPTRTSDYGIKVYNDDGVWGTAGLEASPVLTTNNFWQGSSDPACAGAPGTPTMSAESSVGRT